MRAGAKLLQGSAPSVLSLCSCHSCIAELMLPALRRLLRALQQLQLTRLAACRWTTTVQLWGC